MNVTVLRWRGVEIPAYIAMLYLGCTAGLFVGAAVAAASGLDASRFALAMILLLIPAFVGARLLFVVENWAAYRGEPRRIWRRSEGGSALYGGLLLSFAISPPVLALFDLRFWSFWDAAAFTMLVGLVFTRIGCAINGCCGGRPTSGPLGMRLPDHRRVWERRIPTQLLEAAWALAVLVAALLLRPDAPFAGAVFAGVVAAYGAGRLVLEPTRAEAGSTGSRVNIALSALLLAGGSIVLSGA